MSKIHVAIDTGRSSVKVVFLGGKFLFPFTFSRSKTVEAESNVLFNKDVSHYATIDGETYLFGKTARLTGDHVFENTEGEQFKEVATKATLYGIARALDSLKLSNVLVEPAINLTFNNFFMKKEYQTSLLGNHEVFLLQEDRKIQFKIERVAVLYQGYSGLLDIAMDKNYSVLPEYRESSGLVVDIGRRTVDFLSAEEMSVKNGHSVELGTHKVFERAIEILKKDHSVVKELYEVEGLSISRKKIRKLDGTVVDVEKIIDVAVDSFTQDLFFAMRSFFEKKTPDYLVMFGGGSFLFENAFKKMYPVVRIPQDTIFTNANGLFKFLKRLEIESK